MLLLTWLLLSGAALGVAQSLAPVSNIGSTIDWEEGSPYEAAARVFPRRCAL